ncbi:MAG TPA: endonuclease III [Planctomycetaceae bacterium]|jgi:endonuclease-3|nr:endonuclease III [Planctomycetaceae bacterium]
MGKSSKPKAPLTAKRPAAKPRASARGPAKTIAKAAAKKARAAVAKPSTVPSDLRAQAKQVIRGLAKAYPDATCALTHQSAYQLLVATILSAQCTDERVNMVTPVLFAKYPDVRALAAADQSELEAIIRSTGFFRAKSNSLRGMARGVLENFGGEIPRTLQDLITLPGVGRKTANVVLGTVWGIASGIVVDTHVKRITNLLGLVTSTNPEQIEQDLMPLIPQSEWVDFSHRLIHHGRRICIARRPQCPICPLLSCCRRVGLPPLE